MPLDEAYLVWLYRQVGGSVDNINLAKTYWNLLRILHEKKFTWSPQIENDGNRAQEGRALRKEFLAETNIIVDDPGWLDFECSMLELLVALAFAVAFEGGGTQEERFWEMITNLGLLECVDAAEINEDAVDMTLNVVINRQYTRNGHGGLFPLNARRPKNDQRALELWYQANDYLLERL